MVAAKSKSRLDTLVLKSGLAQSRHQAQGLILAGRVLVNDTPYDKPGVRVADDSVLRLKGEVAQYVGRGGEKLAGALAHFSVDLHDVIALDVGASTGGFTDCLLQHGAKKVYAVDVGHNQLAHQLRIDPRVCVMEKINARELRVEQFAEKPNFVTMDLSFIGIEKVLPSVFAVCATQTRCMLLVKPQFELGPEEIVKGGTLRDQRKGEQAVLAVAEFLERNGYQVTGYQASVLRGYKKGNQEYFLYAQTAG